MRSLPQRSVLRHAFRASLVLAAAAACLRGAPGIPASPARGNVRIAGAGTLSAVEVEGVIQTAAEATAGDRMAVTVVDRAGRILGMWHRASATSNDDELSLSLARTGAFFANDQAPLSSRTVRFISSIHFPPGVRNQPSGALYGIENTNRVNYNVTFNPGKEYPYPTNIDNTGPSLGITTGKVDVLDSRPGAVNPAGFPIYKDGQVVGGVGVAGVGSVEDDYRPAELAAFKATQLSPSIRFPFSARAVIFVGGIALPYVSPQVLNTVRDGRQLPGVTPGVYDGSAPRFRVAPTAGGIAPEGYLVGPMAGGDFTQAEVEQLVEQSLRVAERARALIRLPLGRRTRMVISVGDADGNILALYRMPDSTIFSLDVAVAKARNVVYFSGESVPNTELPGLPPGTAITNRTISFGAQPLFPPGISRTSPGPFFDLFLFDTANPGSQGGQPDNPNQNGVVFFPGSSPLYRNGELIGGLGISGDGVEQDDLVAHGGARGFRAPTGIRADRKRIRRVRIPYLKFPRNPYK
ncbi:MAG: GlcG/HbpS family heme-binding protein [Actinomycetota bacterium]